MKVVIINPTYNEANNIIPLVTELQGEFKFISHDMHILVVDDNSPDGTAGEVEKLQSSYKNLHLLSGQKAGLGAAYIRGIKHAINKLNADVIFQMDADLSHNPKVVKQMIAEIDSGADFVIGSRYVKGGSIPKEWGLGRRLNSFLGNIVSRYVAGIYKVKDCTSGFRSIRVTILKQIDLNNLNVMGYAFLVALLHEALVHGAKVKEIPINFIDRTEGVSKLGLKDIIEFVINAWWIRMRNSKTFIRFALVGISGVFVNIGSLTLLLALEINKYIASPIAIQISIITNFMLNNFWTFNDRETNDHIKIKGLKFNLVSFVSLGVSYSLFVALSAIFPSWPPQICQLIGIAPAMLINYFLNNYWTFGKEKNRLDKV